MCVCLSAQTKHISDQMAAAKAEPQPEAVSGCAWWCPGHAHLCFTSHETTQIVGASPTPCASFLLCPADLHLIAAILFVPRVGVANRRHHKVAAIYVHISLSAVLNIYKLYVHLYNMPCPSVSPPLPLSLPLSLSPPFSAVVFVVT